MKNYKGYKIVQDEWTDGSKHQVLDISVGCGACEDEIQPGHFACSTTPEDIRDDENVHIYFQDNSWVAELIK